MCCGEKTLKFTVITSLKGTSCVLLLPADLCFVETGETGDELLSPVGEWISSTTVVFAVGLIEGDSVAVIAPLCSLLIPIADTMVLFGELMNDDSASLADTSPSALLDFKLIMSSVSS